MFEITPHNSAIVIETKSHYFIEGVRFGDLCIGSPFFNSFKNSYGDYYLRWFEKKRMDNVFIHRDNNRLMALLKLKIEDESEDYSEMSQKFRPARRLKISSLKVEPNDKGIGEMFMEVIINFAIENRITEIYGTIPIELDQHDKLITYLLKHGFTHNGFKTSDYLIEEVFSLQIKAEI